MANKVAMTYAPVENASKMFNMKAQMHRMVAKACKTIANALKASFFGAVLFAELIRRLELIAEKSEKLAKICDEFSQDLTRAVQDHKKGDYKAGSYFGEGVSR